MKKKKLFNENDIEYYTRQFIVIRCTQAITIVVNLNNVNFFQIKIILTCIDLMSNCGIMKVQNKILDGWNAFADGLVGLTNKLLRVEGIK